MPLWLARLVCRLILHRWTPWIASDLYRGPVRFCRRCVACECMLKVVK